MNFVAQIVGGIAVSLWVVSIQNEKRKNVLVYQGFANFLYMIEYALLGAFSASSMNMISTIRCFLFSKSRNENQNGSKLQVVLFSILIILLGLFTYDGVLSIIPPFITILYTISSWHKNVFFNRLAVLFAAIIWIYYNYMVGAYISVLGNVFEIASFIVAYVRFKNN